MFPRCCSQATNNMLDVLNTILPEKAGGTVAGMKLPACDSGEVALET